MATLASFSSSSERRSWNADKKAPSPSISSAESPTGTGDRRQAGEVPSATSEPTTEQIDREPRDEACFLSGGGERRGDG